jgi:hypothetical protein
MAQPVILAAPEAEIRRIMVQSHPWQIVLQTLSQKKNQCKKKGWGSGSSGKSACLFSKHEALSSNHQKQNKKNCLQKI